MLRVFMTLTLLGGGCYAAGTPAIGLMPMPAKVEPATGSLAIDVTFSAVAAGCPDGRMGAAVNRIADRISRQTGIPFGLVKPAQGARPTLQVECASAGAALPALGEDESYTLDITAE